MPVTKNYDVMTDELWDEFDSGTKPLTDTLFLEPHNQLVRQWKVESEDATFQAKLDGAISRFGAVSVWGFETFAKEAAAAGYSVVFMEDPKEVFDWKASLAKEPPVEVNSKLDGRLDRNGKPLRLVKGFLPFQAVGLNFALSTDRFTYGAWDTGTGKTLLAEGIILAKRESGYGPKKDEGYDLVIYTNKPNNLYNAQRKLKEHTGLDATVLTGTPKKREQTFAKIADQMQNGEQPILIINAEKFREDTPWLMLLVEDKRVLVVFDEMPTKYANRATSLYRATCEVLYKSFIISSGKKSKGKKIFYPKAGEDRPSEVFYLALSATPIRNSPEDLFNCVRLMDSTVYGSINNFNSLFAGPRDRWNNVISWHNLDLMGAMVAHAMHKADKKADPEIASQFPAKLPHETVWCDMDSATEKLYAKLQNEYKNIGVASMLDFDEILAAIGCFQMILNNPRSVLASALSYEAYLKQRETFLIYAHTADELKEWDKKNKDGSEVALKLRTLVGDDSKFTDKDAKGECTVSKMIQLREKIENHDDKVIVFSDKNDVALPYIAEWFDKWGISYVEYHGTLSATQKQEAQDKFRNDPSVQVFLSSDAGQDSIDLPEASMTIHYSDPWTQATKLQRANRQDRIDSVKESVQEITLRVPNTVEDRKAEILTTKAAYQTRVDGGQAEQAEQLRKSDFLFILTGERG